MVNICSNIYRYTDTIIDCIRTHMHKLFPSSLILLLMTVHIPSSAMHSSLNRASHFVLKKYAAAVGAISGFTLAGQSAVAHTHVESKAQKIEILQKSPSFEQKQAIKKAFCDKLLASAAGPVAKQYLEEFEFEEESLKQELYKLVNIRPEEFQKNFVGFYNYYSKQEHVPYPSNVDASSIRIIERSGRDCIDAVLDKAGVDKKLINFVYCKRIPISPNAHFGAGFNAIFIGSSGIPNNENLYKAIIGHELTHVLFDDWVRSAVLSHYCDKKYEDFKNKYSRFYEKRADIVGCLLSSEYARAMAKWLYKSGPHGLQTHPEHHLREAYLHKLYTQTEYIEREARRQKEWQDPFYGFCAA